MLKNPGLRRGFALGFVFSLVVEAIARTEAFRFSQRCSEVHITGRYHVGFDHRGAQAGAPRFTLLRRISRWCCQNRPPGHVSSDWPLRLKFWC